jgi:molecular chaperone DnaJ
MNSKDYYQILGIERNSSEEEMKKAYRRLSLKYHPDRQMSLDDKKIAEKKMAGINQAYQVLSDKEKRQDYDRYGSGNAFQRNSYSTAGFQTGSNDFSDFFQDIFDIFGNKGGGVQ